MQEVKSWALQLGGRELRISTGLLAKQANGAVTVRYGETVVLATAVMSKSAGQSRGYFPLMVDYEERYYAAGKIKGSRFIKREGRPSEDAILSGRAVDRTVRPLFDGRMRSEVQVVATVLSIDGENDPDTVAIIAASAALAISDIPWNGPVAAVRVGRLNGEFVLNPSTEERENDNALDLLIAGTKEKVNMIEAGANELPEDEMAKAFEFGFENVRKIAEFIESIRNEVGKPKSKAIILAGPNGFDENLKGFLREAGLAEALFSAMKKEEKYAEIAEIE
jgi:polyribonucleotide nucleotidyltransferase